MQDSTGLSPSNLSLSISSIKHFLKLNLKIIISNPIQSNPAYQMNLMVIGYFIDTTFRVYPSKPESKETPVAGNQRSPAMKLPTVKALASAGVSEG